MSAVVIKIQDKKDENTSLFPELGKNPLVRGDVQFVGILQGGMASGKTSIALHSVIDGKTIMLEISAEFLDAINSARKGAESRWIEEGTFNKNIDPQQN